MNDILSIKEVMFNNNGEFVKGIDLTVDINDVSFTVPIDTRRISVEKLQKIVNYYDDE